MVSAVGGASCRMRDRQRRIVIALACGGRPGRSPPSPSHRWDLRQMLLDLGDEGIASFASTACSRRAASGMSGARAGRARDRAATGDDRHGEAAMPSAPSGCCGRARLLSSARGKAARDLVARRLGLGRRRSVPRSTSRSSSASWSRNTACVEAARAGRRRCPPHQGQTAPADHRRGQPANRPGHQISPLVSRSVRMQIRRQRQLPSHCRMAAMGRRKPVVAQPPIC